MRETLWLRRGWVLAWLALVAVSYVIRNPVPIDETRYLTVAWEMWLRGNFLVPHLNGATYAHKPPLMFWLFQAGWKVFGVNGWWPRLVPPLFVLASLFMTVALAKRFWPDRPRAAVLAPWLLMGSFYWAFYTPTTMFDMMLAGFTVMGVWGLWLASQGRAWLGWATVAVAIGLGILTKGPVILLDMGFPALLAPWWSDGARRRPLAWYGSLLAAIAVGAGIALSWALPAAHAGGPAYEEALLWHQTADRMVKSFAHRRPVWWYLPILPVMLFPWLLWPPLYRQFARLRSGLDPASRLCIAWALPTVVAFSMVSGKQPHYLLPLFPAFALLAARVLDAGSRPAERWAQLLPALSLIAMGAVLLSVPLLHLRQLPEWAVQLHPLWGALIAGLGMLLLLRPWADAADAVMPLAVISVLGTILFTAGFFQAAGPAYDVTPTARFLAKLEAKDVPIAHLGKYHGQYQFLGRLHRPLDVVQEGGLRAWAASHPKGEVVIYSSDPPPSTGPRPSFLQRYKGGWVAVWNAATLCSFHNCQPPERPAPEETGSDS